MKRFITAAGLRMRIGSRIYKWYRRAILRIQPKNVDRRAKIVEAAKWGVANEPEIHYSEAAIRSEAITQPYGKLPLTTDCSGFATYCYKHAGLPDPNGLGYKELGFTGTLLSHAKEILTVKDALPGDLIVYGPGTGAHVAIIVGSGPDPMTVSHGREIGPEYVRANADIREPKRICRYI